MAHLYYPLFEVLNTKLSSHYFELNKTIALDKNFKKFQFCLNKNIHFNDGTLISLEDLIFSLKNIHFYQEDLPNIINLKKINGCLTVELEKSSVDYFHRLTGFSTTLLKNEDHKIPVGLGPYKLVNHDINNIKLQSINKVHYTFIEFIKTSDADEGIKNNLTDWNHVFRIRIPPSIIKNSQKVVRPLNKYYAFVINHRDKSFRKKVSKCLDKEFFIRKTVNFKLISNNTFWSVLKKWTVF